MLGAHFLLSAQRQRRLGDFSMTDLKDKSFPVGFLLMNEIEIVFFFFN